MNIGERLYNRRKELNMTLEEVGKIVGVSKSTVRKWEIGSIKNMRQDKIALLAKALKVSPAFLFGWENESNGHYTDKNQSHTKSADHMNNSPDTSVSFPVIGDVAAHFGSDAIEEDTGIRVDIPKSWLHGNPASDYFVLRVSGNSMFPDFQDGDYVLVRKQTSVDSGSIAVILYDSDLATIKQVKYVSGEDWLELIPRNPEYATKRVEGIDLEECKVFGLVMRLIRIVKE